MKLQHYFLSLILFLILIENASGFSVPAIQTDKEYEEGLYIGKHLEVLNEKDLFFLLNSEWKVEPVYIEKMLSGELHPEGNMLFDVSDTPQGYEVRMEIIDKPNTIRKIRWGIDDLTRHGEYLRFNPIDRSIPFLDFRPHSYWLRFRVNNNNSTAISLRLELDKHFFSFIDLFSQDNSEWSVQRGDFIQSLAERSLPHRNLTYPITVNPGLNTYYMRVDSWFVDSVPLRIWTQNGFDNHKILDDTFHKVLISIFLFIFAFNLLVYFIIKDSSYLYLSLMTILGLVVHLAGSGVGFELLWSDNSFIGLLVLIYAMPLSYLVSLQFCRAFIDTRLFMPEIDRIIKYTIWFIASLIPLYIVLSAFLMKYFLGFNLVLEYLFYLPVLVAAIKITRSGNHSGIFLLIGIILHYLALVEWFLTSLNIVPYQLINFLHIKGASFLIILTLGLTHKIKTMQESLADLRQKKNQKSITDATRTKVQSIKDFLTENYKENHTRDSLSELVKISPDHLSRMFKQETGKRIADFINDIRIKKASKLLRESDDKVITIAYEVGFSSLRTFNKVFPQIMGCSPSEYRKQHAGSPVESHK